MVDKFDHLISNISCLSLSHQIYFDFSVEIYIYIYIVQACGYIDAIIPESEEVCKQLVEDNLAGIIDAIVEQQLTPTAVSLYACTACPYIILQTSNK